MRTWDWKPREGGIGEISFRMNELLTKQTPLDPHVGDDRRFRCSNWYCWDVLCRAGMRHK